MLLAPLAQPLTLLGRKLPITLTRGLAFLGTHLLPPLPVLHDPLALVGRQLLELLEALKDPFAALGR